MISKVRLAAWRMLPGHKVNGRVQSSWASSTGKVGGGRQPEQPYSAVPAVIVTGGRGTQ